MIPSSMSATRVSRMSQLMTRVFRGILARCAAGHLDLAKGLAGLAAPSQDHVLAAAFRGQSRGAEWGEVTTPLPTCQAGGTAAENRTAGVGAPPGNYPPAVAPPPFLVLDIETVLDPELPIVQLSEVERLPAPPHHK